MNWIDWTGTVLGALFFAMLHHLMKGRGSRLPGGWVLRSLLALMGGIFLTFSIVGVLLRSGLALLPIVIIGGATVFALFVAIVDIASDRRADKPALLALAVLPLLLVAGAGPLAQAGTRAVTSIHDGTTSQIGPAIGTGR